MLSTIKQLKELNLKAKKKLGQNFLIDQNIVNKLIKSSHLKTSDIVLEIGPGLGAITLALAKKVKKVIAIEKDRELCHVLKEILRENKVGNVEVVNADILNFQFPPKESSLHSLPTGQAKYTVVANLPYNIAAAVIMKFLENENKPESLTIMIQKEVAQRICSQPPKMNKLAVFSQIYSTPKIIEI